MKSNKFYTALAVCAFIFASCEQSNQPPTSTPERSGMPTKPDLAQVKTEVQAWENALSNALNARDINATIALYADDVACLPEKMPMLVGKTALKTSIEKFFAEVPKELKISYETNEVFSEGNFVTAVGREIVKDASGKEVSTGKYIHLLEKQDNKYLCRREIWNTDHE